MDQSRLLNLGRFLTELGRDFCYIGSEYPVQVGGQDFALDLLFFHRGLNCLLAIELKVTAFQPEHLGKLNFYLDALDRDVRKPHENPAIGLLLCASKDSEVVEYALSRTLSPALNAPSSQSASPRRRESWPSRLRTRSMTRGMRCADQGLSLSRSLAFANSRIGGSTVPSGEHAGNRARPGIGLNRQQARMALRDVEHDRPGLEQAEIAFFIGRYLPERMQRQMGGLLHRLERNRAHLVRLA